MDDSDQVDESAKPQFARVKFCDSKRMETVSISAIKRFTAHSCKDFNSRQKYKVKIAETGEYTSCNILMLAGQLYLTYFH